jgi:hypothetical protein
MKKSREIHDNHTDSHHVYCHWLTACSFLPSHLSTDLHMRLINFCLDSSHEISINAPQFHTWDWSSALIFHIRLINFYLDSSHEISINAPQFCTWDRSSALILPMRFINFCLDSSHEISINVPQFCTWDWSSALILHMRLINLSWFFTWDWSISVLILHMKSINLPQFHSWGWSSSLILHIRLIICLDSSHKIDLSVLIVHMRSINFCLDSSHEIDQFLSWFFTWDQSISVLILHMSNQCVLILHMRLINFCLDSSDEVNGLICLISSHEINGSICLNSSHEINWSIHLPSSLTAYCASLKTHPFREPAWMTHIAHLEYNIMSFQIVTLNFSHCELHSPPNPTHFPKFQAHSQFYIRLAYFSSSLTGWKSLFWQASAHYAGTASPRGSPVQPKWAC